MIKVISYKYIKRIRKMMRGYKNLRKSGELEKIAKLKKELTEYSLKNKSNNYSKLIFSEALSSSELIVRQYLLSRVAGERLTKALLISKANVDSKVICIMPLDWHPIIEKNGFKVAKIRSTLLWIAYVFAIYAKGVILSIKVLLLFINSNKRQKISEHPYAYFDDLKPNNLPTKDTNRSNRTIIDWYMQWNGRNKNVKEIRHSVESKNESLKKQNFILKYQRGVVTEFYSWDHIIKFLNWLFLTTTLIMYDIIRVRWCNALMFYEAIYAVKFKILNRKEIGAEYFFHNSNAIYRPLWTYAAETAGAKIYFYFYSTNNRNFDNINKCKAPPFGWQATNWPICLVWDEYQVKFMRSAVNTRSLIINVGEIWFSDSESLGANFNEKKAISVFDVQPFRSSKYMSFGLGYEYYIPENCIGFISDVQEVLAEEGLVMLFKRKRDIGNNLHPKYRLFLNKILCENNVIEVNPSISASSLVTKSIAVISMPYTSTALVGLHNGKSSTYYDPFGKVAKGDCAAHGLDVLIGKNELREWVRKVKILNASNQRSKI